MLRAAPFFQRQPRAPKVAFRPFLEGGPELLRPCCRVCLWLSPDNRHSACYSNASDVPHGQILRALSCQRIEPRAPAAASYNPGTGSLARRRGQRSLGTETTLLAPLCEKAVSQEPERWWKLWHPLALQVIHDLATRQPGGDDPHRSRSVKQDEVDRARRSARRPVRRPTMDIG